MVALRYSMTINGIEQIAITKLDVLDGFDEIRICTGYEANGKRLKTFPTDLQTLARVQPVYESYPGWKQELSGIRDYKDLPANAQRYLETIASLTGIPIRIVSVGPRRDQTILLS